MDWLISHTRKISIHSVWIYKHIMSNYPHIFKSNKPIITDLQILLSALYKIQHYYVYLVLWCLILLWIIKIIIIIRLVVTCVRQCLHVLPFKIFYWTLSEQITEAWHSFLQIHFRDFLFFIFFLPASCIHTFFYRYLLAVSTGFHFTSS